MSPGDVNAAQMERWSEMNAERLERLAALEHEQWAHWTKYMLVVLQPYFDILDEDEGPVAEVVDRWRLQIRTPYADLSEEEKESDREWARKALAITNRSVVQLTEHPEGENRGKAGGVVRTDGAGQLRPQIDTISDLKTLLDAAVAPFDYQEQARWVRQQNAGHNALKVALALLVECLPYLSDRVVFFKDLDEPPPVELLTLVAKLAALAVKAEGGSL